MIYPDRDSLSEELEILRLMLARDEIFSTSPNSRRQSGALLNKIRKLEDELLKFEDQSFY